MDEEKYEIPREDQEIRERMARSFHGHLEGVVEECKNLKPGWDYRASVAAALTGVLLSFMVGSFPPLGDARWEEWGQALVLKGKKMKVLFDEKKKKAGAADSAPG